MGPGPPARAPHREEGFALPTAGGAERRASRVRTREGTAGPSTGLQPHHVQWGSAMGQQHRRRNQKHTGNLSSSPLPSPRRHRGCNPRRCGLCALPLHTETQSVVGPWVGGVPGAMLSPNTMQTEPQERPHHKEPPTGDAVRVMGSVGVRFITSEGGEPGPA